MLSFNDSATNIQEAFNLNVKDRLYANKVVDELLQTKPIPPVVWFIRRIWIDEVMSDNAKAFMIFTIGRHYQNEVRRGGE